MRPRALRVETGSRFVADSRAPAVAGANLPLASTAGGEGGYAERRAGFVLVAVLVVVMLGSMVAVSLLFRLKAEDTASAASAAGEQAWAAAMSGVHEAMRVVEVAPAGSLAWREQPGAFRDRFVFEDGVDRWYFSVFTAADWDAREPVRFGLTDEASKLNLNEATEAMLMKLPGMTPALTQALLDFMDADDTARPEGAEQEFYDGLPRPYAIPNGPLSTLDELVLVRGFTPAVVSGEDANLNFSLDPNEDDGEELSPPDNKDGKLDPGLRPYVTVTSYDLNEDDEGYPRVDINDAQDNSYNSKFPPAVTNYIAALRRSKVRVAHPADLLEARARLKDENGKEAEMESGVGRDELEPVLDQLTTSTEARLPGLINVNTAPAAVLQTVPGLDESLAESIVAARKTLAPERRRTIAWLYQEGLVDAAVFKQIAPRLTARSFQYSFHVVGYGVPSGRYRVLDVILDFGQIKPVIVYLRDITRLGLPFRIEASPLEATFAARAGGGGARRPVPALPPWAAAAAGTDGQGIRSRMNIRMKRLGKEAARG